MNDDLYKILDIIGFKLDEHVASLNYKRLTYIYESFYVNIEERDDIIEYYFYDENISPYDIFPNGYLGNDVNKLTKSLRNTFRKLRVNDLLEDLD